MPLYESTAAPLKWMRLGEGDRLVTFFTLEYGKVKAVAKAAAKPKSRFGGRLEPFNIVKMIAFGKEKTELLRLNSCDIVERLPALAGDLGRMTRGWACAELVDHIQKDRDVNRDGFGLLAAAWRALAAEDDAARQDLLLRIFELKFLETAGLKPVLDRCVSCGGGIAGPAGGFNAARGGAICQACLKKDPSASKVSAGAVALMRKSLQTPMEKAGRLAAGKGIMEEIGSATAEFIRTHVRGVMRTERFIRMAGMSAWGDVAREGK